jgi:hypothetical protein
MRSNPSNPRPTIARRDKFDTTGFMPKGLCRTSVGDRPIGIGDAEQPTELQKTKFKFRSWDWIWGQARLNRRQNNKLVFN